MNAKDLLEFNYYPSLYEKRGKIINHVVCKVKSKKSGNSFVSLGLEVGQAELNEKQTEWFNRHAEEIAEAVDTLNPRRFKLLDQFCSECDIQDD